MKVETMRKIDRWVGVPLCFLLSPFGWFFDLLAGSRKRKPDVSRTLFIELSEMGSAVLADPAMRKLQRDGSAELFFIIFRKNYKSLGILNTVQPQNIFAMNADNFFTLVGDIFRFIGWSRRNRITTVIDLELFSRFTALLSLFSGARSRVGFTNFHDEGLYRGNIVNCPVRYNPHVHIAVNFISLINTALGYHDNPYATTPVLAEELVLAKAPAVPEGVAAVKAKIQSLYPRWNGETVVLVNPNASDLLPQRRWQQENFASVSRTLLDTFPNIIIVATGARGEKDYVQAVVNQVNNDRCVNSAGVFLFEELVPLYHVGACMLTNDSGPAHFAAVTPLKVFVLFGPESPKLYQPLGNAESFYLGLPCSPCVSAANHRKTTCLTRPCITTISPLWVTENMRNFLSAYLAN